MLACCHVEWHGFARRLPCGYRELNVIAVNRGLKLVSEESVESLFDSLGSLMH
jgi:hypothetical protein